MPDRRRVWFNYHLPMQQSATIVGTNPVVITVNASIGTVSNNISDNHNHHSSHHPTPPTHHPHHNHHPPHHPAHNHLQSHPHLHHNHNLQQQHSQIHHVKQQQQLQSQQSPPTQSMDHITSVANFMSRSNNTTPTTATNNNNNTNTNTNTNTNSSQNNKNDNNNNTTNNTNTTTNNKVNNPNNINNNNNNNNNNNSAGNNNNNKNSNCINTGTQPNPMKNPSSVDAIHFSSSQPPPQQQPTVTTTAAQAVITVVAPSSQTTEMISAQPVVVQVSSNTAPPQYIAVSSDNGQHCVTQVNAIKLEQNTEPDEPPPHAAYDDYSSVFSNGANTTGPMTYYVADSYPATYTYSTGIPETYVMMDQSAATDPINHPQITSNNGQIGHRDTSQNIIPTEESYKTSYTSNRLSVQPQTVNWLVENYETADGVSLPRSTLYTHYQQHCQQTNIDPVNAASFGKLIRSVFVGLRTRRLGTRGNSKYHYYGIRVKNSSALMDNSNGAVENSTMPPVKKSKLNNSNNSNNNNNINNNISANNKNMANDVHLAITSKESLQTYLGNAEQLLDTVWPSSNTTTFSNSISISATMANVNTTDSQPQDESQKMLHLNLFIKYYRTHYEKIIVAISELNFHEIENIWLTFWQPAVDNTNPQSNQFSVEVLKDLTKMDFNKWIGQTDYTMYNSIISDLLLPNLLKPIPQPLTQQIRNFAKCIEKWMLNALQGYSEEFIHIKISAVRALSHMLRRYTSLNHLSTAACSVLKNEQQVMQMINDLNKVDFKNIQEQASWVCECNEEMVNQIENSFKTFLQQSDPYEQWALWCEQMMEMCLPNNETTEMAINATKQFFFKWGLYCSLVMRDLTLRSAQSFGSFHLLRLLLDDYIFYLAEQRIAKIQVTTSLQMLATRLLSEIQN